MNPNALIPLILYEDNHLLVAVKPPGVLSQAGELELPDMLTLLKADLKVRHAKPGNVFLGLVHRLDVNVGGVMVFAKTSKAASRLSEQIRERVFEKRYVAVVQGLLEPHASGRLDDRVVKDKRSGTSKNTDDQSGKAASLTYRVLAVSTERMQSLLDVVLETGRFHQIRMQFASRGNPLVGDAKYGGSQPSTTRQIGLWAYRLGFMHPISNEPMSFVSFPEGEMFVPFRESLTALTL